jgi:hypothetical protein
MTETMTLDAFLAANMGSFYPTAVLHYPYTLPQEAMRWDNVDHMRRTVDASGSQFFTPGAMRWHSSRLSDELIAGRFFVTSERDTHRTEYHAREYAVRWVYNYGEDGTRLQVGDLDTRYPSLAAAKRAARLLASLIDA